jgi:phage-related protein
MKEYTDFYYDGISSSEMGLINVSVGGGLFEESFIAPRKLNETKVRGNDKPYFIDIEREPLSFQLEFAFVNPFDKKKIAEVARWLDKEHYAEFYFTENSDRRFFCMLVSDPELIHNGIGQGYISVEMRCNSPYSYSQEYLSAEIDFSSNVPEGTNYSFMNFGHKMLMPELWIKKVGDGDISIENRANKGWFQFVGLQDKEIVYVDNEREHIETDIIGEYRFDNFNDNYLELEPGRNILNVKGNCILQFRYRFITIQG